MVGVGVGQHKTRLRLMSESNDSSRQTCRQAIVGRDLLTGL